MDNIETHQEINTHLCGKPVRLEKGYSKVVMQTNEQMSVDTKGLVHGGFIFGLADYAAMIAVNDPNVVLGAAQVKFKKPVRVGELVEAEAKIVEEDKNKRHVDVSVTSNSVEVFSGSFTCFILDKHVLDY